MAIFSDNPNCAPNQYENIIPNTIEIWYNIDSLLYKDISKPEKNTGKKFSKLKKIDQKVDFSSQIHLNSYYFL